MLYAIQDPKTASDLWALPLTGERPSTGSGRPDLSTALKVTPSGSRGEPVEGRKPFPVVQTSFDDIQGQFSPDGRWLAYASNESGRYEIYIRSFPEAGGRWQVSTAGGTQPRWRRDARNSIMWRQTLD